MRVLGIETSCDETGVALVDGEGMVLAEAVASQERIHAPYAGVVPELASRQHLRLLAPLTGMVMRNAGCRLSQVDLVGVTSGPGLAGCLLAGVSFAKGLAFGIGAPLIGVNHLEAHLYSCSLGGRVVFPALALLVSGGHTLLVLAKEWGSYECLGETQDDAAGEAFDKVATMIDLPFPGGPAIEARARRGGGGGGVRFPRPLMGSDDLNFSFSGLKTAVLYHMKKRGGKPLGGEEIDAVARGFQDAVRDVLVKKTIDAARRRRVRCLLLAGGVARNEALRGGLREAAEAEGLPLLCAPHACCTDNGVMVAALAAMKHAAGGREDWSLDIDPGLKLC